MFFVSNLLSSSQAGRRGFDPRLPLHLFNNLGHIAGFNVNAITALSSRSPRGARLEGVTSTLQPNLKSPRVASPAAGCHFSGVCGSTLVRRHSGFLAADAR